MLYQVLDCLKTIKPFYLEDFVGGTKKTTRFAGITSQIAKKGYYVFAMCV